MFSVDVTVILCGLLGELKEDCVLNPRQSSHIIHFREAYLLPEWQQTQSRRGFMDWFVFATRTPGLWGGGNLCGADFSFFVLYGSSPSNPLGSDSEWWNGYQKWMMQRGLWVSSVGCTLMGVHAGHGHCRKILSLRLLIEVSCVSQGVYIRIVMPDIISIHVFGVPPFFECRYCAHAKKKMFENHFIFKWWYFVLHCNIWGNEGFLHRLNHAFGDTLALPDFGLPERSLWKVSSKICPDAWNLFSCAGVRLTLCWLEPLDGKLCLCLIIAPHCGWTGCPSQCVTWPYPWTVSK